MPGRAFLRDLVIDEIAFCVEGMHPGANMLLYKRRDSGPGPIEKEHDPEDPRSFSEHFESARIMEIDGAIDRRLFALLDTTTEIMRSDADDKEARILAAVGAYAETMARDVPELFAGRLAKALNELAAEGRPSADNVHRIVKSELADAGFLPDASGGGGEMEFWKSLSERGQRALKFVLGDRDPAEFFKDTTEDAGKLVAGLLEKAAEWSERIDGLEADLEKAKATPPDPSDPDAILKSIEDPGVRAYVGVQGVAIKKQGAEIIELRKAARTKELEAVVKALDCLPNVDGALVVMLHKADAAGIFDDLQTVLEAANVQARLGKAMKDMGIESIVGDGGGASTVSEADAALVAKAAEIKKAIPTLSDEQAYAKACEDNPDLYTATRAYPAGTVGAQAH